MVVCSYCGAKNDDAAVRCKGCGTSILSVLVPEPRPTRGLDRGLLRHLVPEETMRERIRREVDVELDARIRQATGLQKWWLILKREQEITRRLWNLIYAAFAV